MKVVGARWFDKSVFIDTVVAFSHSFETGQEYYNIERDWLMTSKNPPKINVIKLVIFKELDPYTFSVFLKHDGLASNSVVDYYLVSCEVAWRPSLEKCRNIALFHIEAAPG